MSTSMITTEKQEIEYNRENIELIKRMYCKDATDDELSIFIGQCKRTGLSPENRQIYAMKRKNTMTTMVSIDGLRLIAQRTGEYDGQIGPVWCGEDGEWKDVWLSKGNPVACKVGVARKNCSHVFFAVAHFDEYAGDINSSYSLWKKMPALMIAKCAEALALRKAFPQETSGIYTQDEMDQATKKTFSKKYNLVDDKDIWLSQQIGIKGTGNLTWLQLSDDHPVEDGTPGRKYLEKLATTKWEARPDIAERAKIALKEKEWETETKDTAW